MTEETKLSVIEVVGKGKSRLNMEDLGTVTSFLDEKIDIAEFEDTAIDYCKGKA